MAPLNQSVLSWCRVSALLTMSRQHVGTAQSGWVVCAANQTDALHYNFVSRLFDAVAVTMARSVSSL